MDCSKLPADVHELSILLTTDREIRRLNRDFRKKDKATDVLSFSQIEDGGESALLGDVVISLDTAKRQAKAYDVTFPEEVGRLLIHGILHLFGYDHEKVPKSTAQRMRRTEHRLFTALHRSILTI